MSVRSALKFVVVGALASLAYGCANEDDNTDELLALDSELAVTDVINAGVELRVTASALNFRAGPNTSATVLAVLRNGTRVVTATQSGQNGWVNVRTNDGTVGWVSNRYVTPTGGTDNGNGNTTAGSGSSDNGGSTNNTTPSGASCSASRAVGVVSAPQKALHDSIAFAEGTFERGNDGYNVLYSYQYISNCNRHPNRAIRSGGRTSTASGRYQFLYRTWTSAASARNLATFEPENQERAAVYLIQNVRRATVPQERAMTASEFSNAMSKLSYEWASLPPGRYGQPVKTASQMRSFYCSKAGC